MASQAEREGCHSRANRHRTLASVPTPGTTTPFSATTVMPICFQPIGGCGKRELGRWIRVESPTSPYFNASKSLAAESRRKRLLSGRLAIVASTHGDDGEIFKK